MHFRNAIMQKSVIHDFFFVHPVNMALLVTASLSVKAVYGIC